MRANDQSRLPAKRFFVTRSALRYPILACEVVACKVPQIMDTLVENKKHPHLENNTFLQTFWSFLDRPVIPSDQQGTLDAVQMSCFCKVIDVLLEEKMTEVRHFSF